MAKSILVKKQSEIKNSNTKWQKYPVLADEETIVEDDYAEVTVRKAEFTNIVKPPTPGRFYTYYEVKDIGSTYAHIEIEIKNLNVTGARADSIANVEVVYDNKYAYTGFSTIEDKGGSDLTYTNITNIDPLDKRIIHYLFEVPLEVRESGKPVIFTITVNKDNFSYIFIG